MDQILCVNIMTKKFRWLNTFLCTHKSSTKTSSMCHWGPDGVSLATSAHTSYVIIFLLKLIANSKWKLSFLFYILHCFSPKAASFKERRYNYLLF